MARAYSGYQTVYYKTTFAQRDVPRTAPKTVQRKVNTCDKCNAETLLRYYVPGVGYCCQSCWDEWRTTPVWCNTCADDVHIGRTHITPQCVLDADNHACLVVKKSADVKENAPQARCSGAGDDLRSDGVDWVAKRVAQIKAQRGAESVASEARWLTARKEAMDKRNAALVVKA